jgi:hypothetical protein
MWLFRDLISQNGTGLPTRSTIGKVAAIGPRCLLAANVQQSWEKCQ